MASTDDIKNDPKAGTPELEEIHEPDSIYKPGKGDTGAEPADENIDAAEIGEELKELKDTKVDESAEKDALKEDDENSLETTKSEKSAGDEKEDEGQAIRTLGNTKKRTDGNGTQDPEKRKRKRRRNYDDAPKEEPESDEGENAKNVQNDENDENDDEDEEEDDLVEVDESNIISGGRRTRGKKIDYKKANEEVPLPEDDDEEDDEEFEDKGEEEEV